MSKQLLASALWYAEHGWYVFPCSVGAKEPLIPRSAGGRGLLDATRDADQIRRWWAHSPAANIGVACEPSGLVVVDVDTKNAGDATFEALRAELPASTFDTVTAITPSGGQHLVYRTDGTAVASGAHVLGQGIDIRAIGGYIVVAPSVVAGKSYAWEIDYSPKDRAPSVWPDELAAKIVKRGVAAPLGETQRIPSGERNATLASIAGTLRRRGLDYDEIIGALQVVNYKRCSPPLDYIDIDRIAKSIARYAPEEALGKVEELSEPKTARIEALSVILDGIRNRHDDRGPAMSFGIHTLDERIGGMVRGQVTVLAARTGVGKTAFAEHIAECVAGQHDVLYFALEMGSARITERIAARHEFSSLKEFRSAGRPCHDLSWYESLRLKFVDFREKQPIDAIREATAFHRPALVVIDHARRIRGWLATDGKMRADLAPTQIMQSVTNMAETLGVHVLLLSQATRSADGVRPSLSDLRDSGGVEEEADNVIFLHRPFEYGDPDGGPDNIVEICVWKSREGGKFLTHVGWAGERMAFLDLDASRLENLQYQRCCAGDKKQRRRGVA